MKIIAEAAMNHYGSLPLMWELVDSSMASGADFVKFQLIKESSLYAPGYYEYGDYNIDDVRWLRSQSVIEDEGYSYIVERAQRKYHQNVVTATPFDLESLEFLISTKPAFIKIASGDNNYFELIDEAAKSGHEIIISTGMSTVKQIDDVVNRILRHTSDLVLMHCVAQYPHTLKDSMLATIPQLQERYEGVDIGFSDHSIGYGAAVLAASMGVTWIEKHFTLSKNNGGLDAKHSLEPKQMLEFCDAVNAVSQTLGETRLDMTAEEIKTAERARRGVYYSRDLKSGHTIQTDDLVYLRPERGYALENVNEIIGKVLENDVSGFQPVIKKDIKSGVY